jgi:hypothetical protein
VGQSRRFSVLVFREREREREMHIRYFCCNAYTKYSFISIKRFRRRRFVSSKKKRKKNIIHGKAGRRGPAMDRVRPP